MNLREIHFGDANRILLTQDRIDEWAFMITVVNFLVP